MQHWLRLRKRLQLNNVASVELGVDLNLKNQRYMPHAALSYEVSPCLLRAGAPSCMHAGGPMDPGSFAFLPPKELAVPALALRMSVHLRPSLLTSLKHKGCCGQILRKDGRQLATLRATRQSLFLRKSFLVCPPRVSFTLHAMAGVSYKGAQPHPCQPIF